ncbi:MAG TPA: hydantoinase/oxoprolinase family protein [Acidimicrobiia bacterium]|jgi:N-methylhydantoinase A
MTVGVDVGGTFTDVVVFDGVSIRGWKALTTSDQAAGVIAAISGVESDSATMFLHGTTAGTNALLEGRGARTALVTSRGFEDLIEIGRQARPSLYDVFVDRPPPLVDRSRRFGYDGDLADIVESVVSSGAEAVAVALIRSFDHPEEEMALAAAIGERIGAPVSSGAQVSPAFREYERVATTVLNAFLTPEVSGYLKRLEGATTVRRRLVMTSSGGLLPFESAISYAGRLVLSGPAAGVVAATELGLAKGHQSVISFDMGGTSTDVCRITGGVTAGSPRRAGAGWVNRVPALPVRTIGAGGGSIAWIDQGGALRVGPRSAGSSPGPAAYGMGGDQATVTDANVALGRIPAGLAMGGSVPLDPVAATGALSRLGADLGMEAPSVAAGILEVVDTHMERALRAVSVEEGVDPRDSVLVAFGGAGGLHASRLARRLGAPRTLVPPLSGVFSALGLLLARPRSDALRTVMLGEGSPGLPAAAWSIETEARDAFRRDHGVEGRNLVSIGEVRYAGQAHELAVPMIHEWDGLRRNFESEHNSRFGFVRDGEPIELVNVRAEVTGQPPIGWGDLPAVNVTDVPAPVLDEAGLPIWNRSLLPAGFESSGPGVVIEDDSAVWLEPGDTLTVHSDGTLDIAHR